jgi:hypothetical protein
MGAYYATHACVSSRKVLPFSEGVCYKAGMSFQKYGRMWADGTTELQINRYFYMNDPDPQRRFVHMKAGCRLMFPETVNGHRGHLWNFWTDRRAKAWCRDFTRNIMTWIGPSSSGKSTDAAVFCLWHFLCAPDITTIRVATNFKESLQLRIWAEVTRLWSLYPEGTFAGCNFTPSTMEITCGAIGYIRGIAVKQGTEQQAMESIKGAHTPRTVVICDELDSMPMGVIEAIENPAGGCESFMFIGTGNPTRRLGNPLGVMCTPENGDWKKAGVGMEEWPTKFGVCLFFDGRKSPGVVDPDKYGKFLLNQRQIDDTIRIHGENSPIYWSQRIGFFAPEGMGNSVIDEPTIVQYRMMEIATWERAYYTGIVLDPSYSSGGDRCIARSFTIGMTTDGLVLQYLPSTQIKMILSESLTLSDQIAEKFMEVISSYQIPVNMIGIDCTGTQGAIADFIEARLGKRGIYRIQYSGRCGQLPLDAMVNETVAKGQRPFSNKRAEMYYALRLFGRANMIRGLDRDTANELVQVEWDRNIPPMLVEDKLLVKKRIGKSPDEGDCAVMALDLARYRMGFMYDGDNGQGEQNNTAAQNDVDNREILFQHEWQPEQETTHEQDQIEAGASQQNDSPRWVA